jgi:hypothetical protein
MTNFPIDAPWPTPDPRSGHVPAMASTLVLSMTPITHILVPTDFSESADKAFAYALKLADPVGATVRLVHVFDDPDAAGLYSRLYVPLPAEMRADIMTSVHRELSARAATAHRKVESEVLTGPGLNSSSRRPSSISATSSSRLTGAM